MADEQTLDNPAIVSWRRALAGQLPGAVPEAQMFPQDPGKNIVENIIRGVGSAALNMPQTAVAGWKNVFGLPFGLGGSPAAPTAAPPSPAVPPGGPAAPSPPSTTARVPNPGTEFTYPAGPELPPPPTIPAPPQQKVTGGGNYNQVRALADKGKPGPVDQASLDKASINDVLGGLAKGAGSVDATTPGSFAKALAMSGAGGAQGASTANVRNYEANSAKDKENQQFYQHRAGLEQQIVTAQAAQAQHASQIAFQNAQLAWKTQIENQNAQYDYTAKKLQLEAPKTHFDAKGATVAVMDPQTRQWTSRYVSTQPLSEKLEKIGEYLKGLNVDGEVGDAMRAKAIADTYKDDPMGGEVAMKREAVKSLINKGAGGVVFGKHFQDIATAVKTQFDTKEGGSALLAKSPTEYYSTINDRITAELLNRPEFFATKDWARRGMAHSVFARILAGQ